ncbi:MAG: DNA internalization-related competence protein ComEC/Rec2 [Proteobacteria bacterium]|nr:DNA internalization-related competence protein ComEC/Rec2 [Pseudomonadota bacterium]MBU1715227.1 DNA internalization-related competence protein ComEC/Rec2 [Pseudomonadota bacterium]
MSGRLKNWSAKITGFLQPSLEQGHCTNLLIPVVLSFIGGIILSRHSIVLPAKFWIIVFIFLSFGLLVNYFQAGKRSLYFLLPLFLLAGSLQTVQTDPPPDQSHIFHFATNQQDVVLTGKLKECTTFDGEKSKLIMNVSSIRWPDRAAETKGLVQLTMNGNPPRDLFPGDLFMARATISQPNTYSTPGTFDYRSFLAARSIWVTGWLRSPSQIIKIKQPPSSWSMEEKLTYRPERLRQQISRFLEDAGLPTGTTALYKALLLGIRTQVPPSLLEDFKTAGCFHLLAISGMHMGLLALLITAVLNYILKKSSWLLLRFPAWKIAALFSIIPLTIYALIAGFQPPVIRSLLMSIALILAIVLDRQHSLNNNIAIAALVILIFDPAILFGASFQLSFGAVIAISAAAPYISGIFTSESTNKPGKLATFHKWLVSSIIISIAALLGTMPLLLLHFNRISLLSPISTLLAAPLLCFWALPLGLTACLLIPFAPTLAKTLIHIGSWGLQVTQWLISFLSDLPFSSLWFSTPSMQEIILYYIMIFGFFLRKKYRLAMPLALIALIILAIIPIIEKIDKNLSDTALVSYLDIGQGSSTLLELPQNYTILIDGGGAGSRHFNVGESIIGPYLWGKNITRLDQLVITHPHSDHTSGLAFIVDKFRPQTIWINFQQSADQELKILTRLARNYGADIKVPPADSILYENGGTKLQCLNNFHPIQQESKTSILSSGADINNHSLVIRLDNNNDSFLFPGDIGTGEEKELISLNKDIDVDVLLSPHHGSATSNSKEFLEKSSPEYMVISAGPFLPDIFPSPLTMEKSGEQKITVLNTAIHGTISFRSNKNKALSMEFTRK